MTDFAPFTTRERELVRDAVLRGTGDIEVFYAGDDTWTGQVLTSVGQDGNNYVYVEAQSAAEVLRKIAAALEEA